MSLSVTAGSRCSVLRVRKSLWVLWLCFSSCRPHSQAGFCFSFACKFAYQQRWAWVLPAQSPHLSEGTSFPRDQQKSQRGFSLA